MDDELKELAKKYKFASANIPSTLTAFSGKKIFRYRKKLLICIESSKNHRNCNKPNQKKGNPENKKLVYVVIFVAVYIFSKSE